MEDIHSLIAAVSCSHRTVIEEKYCVCERREGNRRGRCKSVAKRDASVRRIVLITEQLTPSPRRCRVNNSSVSKRGGDMINL